MPGLSEDLPLVLGEYDDADESNIVKLMRAWMSAIQGLELVLQQLYLQRDVDSAAGAQLDIIGKIVGEARDGLADDIYRRYIRARVAANRSKGTIKDVLRVSELVVDDFDATHVLDNQGAAGFVIRVEDVAVASDVAEVASELVQDAASAGVRAIVESGVSEPSTWFQFDTGTNGLDVGAFIDARG